MAFTPTTAWNVMVSGNALNGGGFDTASTGTDYSQSTSPVFSYTDIVIGATTTQGTSVARPFIAADVGNVISIASGTGFTVQRVQIVSVSVGLATFDKSLGTAASTGGTGNLGGAVARVENIAVSTTPPVAGNNINIQAGTFSYSATGGTITSLSGTAALPIRFIGYGTTPGDYAGTPLLTMTATNTIMFSFSACAYIQWRNVNFSNTAATRAVCFNGTGTNSAGYGSFSDCLFDGFTTALLNGASVFRGFAQLYLIRTTFQNLSGVAFDDAELTTPSYVEDCTFYNCTTGGLRFSPPSAGLTITVARSRFLKCGFGISDVGSIRGSNMLIRNCTFADCTTGINSNETTSEPVVAITGNIFDGCTTGMSFAFAGGVGNSSIFITQNAYGRNTTNYTGISGGAKDIMVPVDPFINRSAGNYGLNNVAGGGALLRAVNAPGTIGGTNYLDIGAIQHQDSGGGAATVAYTFA